MSGLTVEEPGPNACLVGGWSAWFRLLAADAELIAGKAELAGVPTESAVREGVAGVALCDPPLPLKTRVHAYLELSAALGGASRRDEKRLAAEALERCGLEALAKRPLGDLGKLERRAVMIAHAWLGTPRVVCLETPLAELDAQSKAYLLGLIDRVLASSAVIASVVRPHDDPAERALVDRLGRVLVLEASTLVAHGSAEQVFRAGPRYAVTVTRAATEFSGALRAAGATVEAALAPKLASAILAPGTDALPARFLVELPEGGGTDLILDAALGAGAPIVELWPLHVPRAPAGP